MSLNEKQPMVQALALPRPKATRQHARPDKVLSTIEDEDSTRSVTPELTPVPTFERESSPMSPFYNHDELKSESKTNINPFESDLESCIPTNNIGSVSGLTKTNECLVWPGQEALKAKRREAKLQRGCNPMRKLNKRTKVWVKILICLVILGAVVALGLGISKATGASFWKAGNSPV